MARSSRNPINHTLRAVLSLFLIIAVAVGVCLYVNRNLPASSQPLEQTASPVPQQSAPVSTDGTLTAYILDAGQGDCIFLKSPSGKTMLVDASTSGAYEHIDTFLQSQQVKHLDAVIATHPHADHIGAMANVLRHYSVGIYYMTDAVTTTKTFEEVLKVIDDKDIPCLFLTAGESSFIAWDDQVEVCVLSPFEGYDYDINNSSIICRIQFGNTSILLAGDAEEKAELIALSLLPESYFKADVLKLGHHGSSTSTCTAFLTAVDPDYAIASLGKDNSYGHPHRETIEKLTNANITFYRTDESGDIRVTLDGTQVTIATEK